jgi:hypothetical protein
MYFGAGVIRGSASLTAGTWAVRRTNMGREQQVQTLGALYLLYRSHTVQLQAAGYTKREAFWLHFGCLPFLPWAQHSENQLGLTEVFRLYLGIYQYDTDDDIKPEAIPAFLHLLVDRYRMAKDIATIADTSQLERELGRFALPGEHDIARTTRAASIVLHTIAQWQKQAGEDCLPCRLIEDIGGMSPAGPGGAR